MNTVTDPDLPEPAALEHELLRAVERRLIDPLEILTGSAALMDPLREHLSGQAPGWAAALLGDDDAKAVHVASRLIAILFGDDDFAPPAPWWQTAFGRIVARRIGYPGRPAVSGADAAAMLGITRQGVHDLVRRGKLARGAHGGVVTASVQDRLKAVADARRH